MRRTLLIAALGLTLTACQTAKPSLSSQEKTMVQAQGAPLNCKTNVERNPIGGYASYSRCVAERQAAAAEAMGVSPAAYRQYTEQRTNILARVDRGEISLEQAKAEIARLPQPQARKR